MPHTQARFILQDGTSEVRVIDARLHDAEVPYDAGAACVIFDGSFSLCTKVRFRRTGTPSTLGADGLPEFRATEPAPKWVSLSIRKAALRRELDEVTEELYQQLKQSAG